MMCRVAISIMAVVTDKPGSNQQIAEKLIADRHRPGM
jgi:hypothetical protein